jgi:hypothetical protein
VEGSVVGAFSENGKWNPDDCMSGSRREIENGKVFQLRRALQFPPLRGIKGEDFLIYITPNPPLPTFTTFIHGKTTRLNDRTA